MAVRVLLLALVLLGCAACGGDESDTDGAGAQTTAATTDDGGETTVATECDEVDQPDPKADGGQTPPDEPLDASEKPELVVETNCGTFTVTLDAKVAPKTGASLVKLARNGFFDGTIFHRIVPGFVIQGGDPTGTGMGGPGYKTVDVPPSDSRYTKGVVAMAKAGNEAAGTSGSQFFVVTGEDVNLPPDYAIVGEVTDGLEVVERIGELGDELEQPTQTVLIRKVTVQG